MGQNPWFSFINPSKALVPANVDAGGNQTVTISGGNVTTNTTKANFLGNITGNTTVKTTAGVVGAVTVLVGGNATTVYNVGNVSGAAAGNALAVIGSTAGVTQVNLPASAGISVVPGAGCTVGISWS